MSKGVTAKRAGASPDAARGGGDGQKLSANSPALSVIPDNPRSQIGIESRKVTPRSARTKQALSGLLVGHIFNDQAVAGRKRPGMLECLIGPVDPYG